MPEKKKFSSVVPWILFLVLLVFTNVFPRYVLSPLLLRIAADFGLSFDKASSIFLTASVGFISGLFLSGAVSRWLTHRWTIVSAISLSGISILTLSMATSFALFHVLLFLVGFANGLYPGSGIASVQAIATADHRGKGLAIHEGGPNLALIAAPIMTALLAPSIGWRGIMRVVGVIALVAVAFFAVFGRASSERGEPPHFTNLRMLARNRSFWVLTSLLVVAGTGAVGVYFVLPTYLIVDHGLSEALANSVIGIARVVTFGSMFVAGAMSDRVGFRPVAAVVIVVTGIISAMLGIVSGNALIVFVLLQPTAVGAFFPICWVALSDAVPDRARNLSVSLAMAASNLIAGGFSPRILAGLGAAGHFQASFIVLGLAIAAGALLLLLLPTSARENAAG